MSVEEDYARVVVPCGWGRLIFAHTFLEAKDVAHELLREKANSRDIAFYVTDPHLILNAAPQDLFMDPSDTFRINFGKYVPNEFGVPNVRIRGLSARADIQAINRIYSSLQMVTVDSEAFWENRDDPRLKIAVACQGESDEVIGVGIGVDHQLAFRDIQNGSSLWSLAVDPQVAIPSVGEALVRYLIEHFQAQGRQQLDLSVMHSNKEAIHLYEKLGFQRIPVFAIKRCNPINERLYTGVDVDQEFNPYARIIIHEAMRRGISVLPVHPERGYFRLTLGGRSVLCRESLTDLTSAVAMSRCDDKEMTRHALESAGLRLPAQMRASSPEQNLEFLKKYGRLVVKPARGEQGRGVAVNLNSLADMEQAILRAQEE